jgi:hypothetical protein
MMQLTDSIHATTRVGFLLCCLLVVTGCVSTKAPTSSDIATALAHGQTLVLLRVATNSTTGEHLEPFASSLADDNLGVGVGSFETAGKIEWTVDMHYLSDESRADGWFCIFLPAGTHYFAFLPPRRTDVWSYTEMFYNAQRWRVDAPTTASIVYAGSLIVEVDDEPVLFGQKYPSGFRRMEVLDETSIARSLAQQFIPGFSDIKTVLMVKHEGPTIKTTPEN